MPVMKHLLTMIKTVAAANVALIIPVFVQTQLRAFTHYFPAAPSDFLVRFLACTAGAVLARFFWRRDHYVIAVVIPGFYLWADMTRIGQYFVIDSHPFEWVSFFPGPNTVWLLTLTITTLFGTLVGRWLGTKLGDRMQHYGNLGFDR
jgi:hypothetical protein